MTEVANEAERAWLVPIGLRWDSWVKQRGPARVYELASGGRDHKTRRGKRAWIDNWDTGAIDMARGSGDECDG